MVAKYDVQLEACCISEAHQRLLAKVHHTFLRPFYVADVPRELDIICLPVTQQGSSTGICLQDHISEQSAAITFRRYSWRIEVHYSTSRVKIKHHRDYGRELDNLGIINRFVLCLFCIFKATLTMGIKIKGILKVKNLKRNTVPVNGGFLAKFPNVMHRYPSASAILSILKEN